MRLNRAAFGARLGSIGWICPFFANRCLAHRSVHRLALPVDALDVILVLESNDLELMKDSPAWLVVATEGGLRPING